MGMFLTRNPIAALLVFGREYAMQCPLKTQLKENIWKIACRVCSPSILLEILTTSPGLSQVSKKLSTVPFLSGPVFLSRSLICVEGWCYREQPKEVRRCICHLGCCWGHCSSGHTELSPGWPPGRPFLAQHKESWVSPKQFFLFSSCPLPFFLPSLPPSFHAPLFSSFFLSFSPLFCSLPSYKHRELWD